MAPVFLTAELIVCSIAFRCSVCHAQQQNYAVVSKNGSPFASTYSYQKQEEGIITIPFDYQFGQIVLSGRINGLNVKVYYHANSTNCTISSIQASLLLRDGAINPNNINGKIDSGVISAGSRIIIPRLYLGGVLFSNVRLLVSDNMSYPIVIGPRLLSYKGDVYRDIQRRMFVIVSPEQIMQSNTISL